jgi:hypothetical protein
MMSRVAGSDSRITPKASFANRCIHGDIREGFRSSLPGFSIDNEADEEVNGKLRCYEVANRDRYSTGAQFKAFESLLVKCARSSSSLLSVGLIISGAADY